MKSLINSKVWAMVVVFMALSLSSAMADEDDFLLSVRNVTQPTATTIEFDLYLLDTDNTQDFEFAALQMGLLLNTSIYGAGTLTVSYSSAGSGLDVIQQFAGSVDVVAPLAGYDGKTLIRLMANSIPPVPPGAGTGTVISSAGDGTFLARFTITGSVSFTPNTRAGLEFCSSSDMSPLWPTVLYAYIEGNSTPLAVTPGVDAIVDGDPLLNPILPSTFNVTGTDSYCVGTGGMPVGLDGSEVNTSYALFLDSDSLMAIAGTGAAISFGNQTEGTYSVYAYNPAGRVQMTGQAVITETPVNTVTLTSGVGTNIQEVCINTAITTITYTTTGATGIGTPVNLPAGVIASWAADVITISGTPTVSGTFGYSIPLTGGCGTVSATGTITVTANMTAGPASSTPTLCIGTALTNITHTATGATGIGTPVNLPAGVIASWAADVITISGTPTVSGTFGYSIPLTGGCGTVSATGTITVTANMTAGPASSTPTLCIGTSLTNITHTTTGATGIGTSSGLPAGVTASWSANAITISGTPTVSGTFGYSIPLTGGCGNVSATGTITVNALPTITVSTAPSCSTDLLTYSLEVTVSSGTVTSSTGTVADLGGNVWRITGVTVGSGVTVTVTDANTCDNMLSVTSPDCSCPVVSAPVSGGNQSYCSGESLPLLTVTVGAGETADWYNAATEGTLLLAGNTTYTPTAPGTYYAEARVIANNCVSSTRTAVTLTENPLPVVTLGTLPALCVDASAINLTQGSPTGGTYIGTGITDGSAGLFDPSVAGAGTHTITYTYTNGTTGCTADATGTITVTANMTAGPASSTPTLCIGTVLTSITHATTGATGIGTPVNLPTGLDAMWEADVITISGTPTESGSFGYSIPLTGGCGSVSATGTINVTALPGAAGPITGPPTFTPGTTGVAYSVSPISAASTYIWTYSGTGVTINGSGTGVTLDFSASATSGTLSVFGRNSCGDGAAAILSLSPSTKTLTLTSILLQGLYNGAGAMRQALGETGPQWPAGVADHITIELHSSTDYPTVVYTESDVALSVTGSTTITVPAMHAGSYYITVKHRNSVETTTSAAVSFSGTTINYSFGTLAAVFGGNLSLSGDGRYLIFAGDVNQDGVVDTQDYIGVDNDSYNYASGYLVTDVDGNGTVDTNDYIFIDNNNYNYVGAIHP